MKPFTFVGRLPASKSMLNRLLIVQSYFPKLKIQGESSCEDVLTMRDSLAALAALNAEETLNTDGALNAAGALDTVTASNAATALNAGSAGTVLRFLAMRASRIPGQHRITGHPRLFARPQEELIKILRQLGVHAELGQDALTLEGSGWKMHGDTLLVPSARSSQFASAVLLNAWDLPFDLFVALSGTRVSEGYWRMSVQMAERLGMKIDFWDSDFRIPKKQRVQQLGSICEIDMSSAFALAAVAAINGQATFLDFPSSSLQPDAYFSTILERMGVPITHAPGHLRVDRAHRLNGVAVNLKSMPDLFPVLAALCALAEGESELVGAPHLVHKESNRLAHLADLIQRTGREVEIKPDGLVIHGAHPTAKRGKIVFDPDHDHRLAFAAAVLRAGGLDIEILHPEVVNKSFPGFWEIVGWEA